MKRKKKRTGNYRRGRHPLDERHLRAISMLANVPTPTLEEVSAAVGVDRRTLYRWRHRKDFDRLLRMTIDERLSALRKRIPKTGLLAFARRGDTDVIAWFFDKAGYFAK